MVFALAAASVPPTRVTANTRTEGSPRWASSIVGMVVTSSSSMMRGLVSGNSDRATAPGCAAARPGRQAPGRLARAALWRQTHSGCLGFPGRAAGFSGGGSPASCRPARPGGIA